MHAEIVSTQIEWRVYKTPDRRSCEVYMKYDVCEEKKEQYMNRANNWWHKSDWANNNFFFVLKYFIIIITTNLDLRLGQSHTDLMQYAR